MTIEEAIAQARAVAEQGCTEYHEEYGQIADWLEQLVNLRNQKGDYISREDALDCLTGYVPETIEEFAARTIRRIKNLPPADVRPVVQIVDRLDEERKKAKGQWHTDRYWLGWADAMRRARRIVDGSIDEEPMYAPSSADEKMDE